MIRAAIGVIVLGGAAVLFLWWQSVGLAVFGLPFRLEALVAGAIALIALRPLLAIDILFPQRLTIGARGLIAVRRGRTVEIGWGELRGIQLKTVPAGRGGRTHTVTVLLGADATRITFGPVYGVAPLLLAGFIRNIQAAVMGAAPLPILRRASAGLHVITGLKRITRTARRALLAVVGCIVLVIVLAVAVVLFVANDAVHQLTGVLMR